MTFSNTRIKDGSKGSKYSVLHVETKRQFIVYQHPARWDWRIDETIVEEGKPPKVVHVLDRIEFWSKRDALAKLEHLIENPPPPPPPKKVYVPPPPMPPQKWKVPTKPVEFSVRRMPDGYEYRIVGATTHPPIHVWTNEQGWWHARQIDETQQLCTGFPNRQELQVELVFLLSPPEFKNE